MYWVKAFMRPPNLFFKNLPSTATLFCDRKAILVIFVNNEKYIQPDVTRIISLSVLPTK